MAGDVYRVAATRLPRCPRVADVSTVPVLGRILGGRPVRVTAAHRMGAKTATSGRHHCAEATPRAGSAHVCARAEAG